MVCFQVRCRIVAGCRPHELPGLCSESVEGQGPHVMSGFGAWRHVVAAQGESVPCSLNLSPPRLPQPQEFIDAVRRDRLASLFALLERRAAGQRAYILVCGLARHIDAQERKQHHSDMRAGAMVGGWGALGRRDGCWSRRVRGRNAPRGQSAMHETHSTRLCSVLTHCVPSNTSPARRLAVQAPVQQSVKPLIDEFLAGLHVECPRLSFRDAVDEAQVGGQGLEVLLQCHWSASRAVDVWRMALRWVRYGPAVGQVLS